VKDYNAGDVVDLKFTSVSSGVPTALLSGVVDIYKDASATESTEGVTLTSTFASIVGMNHLRVETTADSTFYSDGSKFQAMLSGGTVDGNSVAGYVIGEFSLRYGTVDDIADGTTTLSTDVDDLITTSTAIVAESTATAVVVDSIAAGTTMLSTDADDIISASTSIQAGTTDIQARLPAALVSGRMDSNASAISDSAATADRMEAWFNAFVTGTVETGRDQQIRCFRPIWRKQPTTTTRTRLSFSRAGIY
jgi:hypothetical protein